MDEMAEFLERFRAAWNAHDGERLAALYHPDAERVSPVGTLRGAGAIREAAAQLWRAAPDLRVAFTHWAARGTVVLLEFTDEGTHTGPLTTAAGDVMGSGRAFRVAGAEVLEVREGRIAAERVYFDPGAFLRQLGVAQ